MKKVAVQIGDMVLYRMGEEESRPMLIVETVRDEIVNGIVFTNGPRNRVELSTLKMTQLAGAIFWVVNVKRGDEIGDWYPKPLFVVVGSLSAANRPDEQKEKKE